MNGSSYLLDTCFILGLCNQNPEVLNTFGDIPITRCYISVITRIELLGYANITTEDEAFLQSVLSEITCLPLFDDVEEETIQLRKHHKVKLPDAIILATAKVNTLELLTLDKQLMKLKLSS